MVIRQNGTDHPTLRSCALVCRAFLPSSQACLFSRVELIPTPSDSDGRSRTLHQVFRHSPHICQYVRSLRVVEGLDDMSSTPGGWVSHTPDLVAILEMLNDLKSFAFEARDPHKNLNFQWCNLPEELRRAICRLCRRTDLVNLELIGLGTFTDMTEFPPFVASSALTSLTLRDISLPSLNNAEGLSKGPLGLRRCSFSLPDDTTLGEIIE